MKGGSFKKLFNSITQNAVLLYILLVFAVFNLLSYLQNNNLAAVVLFLVTGYVTTLYTKNMSIVLLSAMMITNLFVCSGYLKKLTLREGLDDLSKSNNAKKAKAQTSNNKDNDSDSEDIVSDSDDDSSDMVNNKIEPTESVNMVTIESETDSEENELDDDNSALSTNSQPGSKCKKGQHKDPRSGICVPDADTVTVVNKETVKNGSKKVAFSNLTEIDASLDGKPAMNYKGTVENAFNSLEDILGPDGMKKMTADTADLAAKQDQLLDAMNKMGPMMDTAQTMLNSLKKFDIGNLLGSSNKN